MHLKEELKQIGLEMTEVEMKPGSPLLGQALADVEVGGGFVVVAIRRNDGRSCVTPSPTSAWRPATRTSSSATAAPFPSSPPASAPGRRPHTEAPPDRPRPTPAKRR